MRLRTLVGLPHFSLTLTSEMVYEQYPLFMYYILVCYVVLRFVLSNNTNGKYLV